MVAAESALESNVQELSKSLRAISFYGGLALGMVTEAMYGPDSHGENLVDAGVYAVTMPILFRFGLKYDWMTAATQGAYTGTGFLIGQTFAKYVRQTFQ